MLRVPLTHILIAFLHPSSGSYILPVLIILSIASGNCASCEQDVPHLVQLPSLGPSHAKKWSFILRAGINRLSFLMVCLYVWAEILLRLSHSGFNIFLLFSVSFTDISTQWTNHFLLSVSKWISCEKSFPLWPVRESWNHFSKTQVISKRSY